MSLQDSIFKGWRMSTFNNDLGMCVAARVFHGI